MKKFTIIFAALVTMTINANSQIPNNGFESLNGWFTGNATLSTDHYPESVGNYSVKLENQLPLTKYLSYGYAVTGSLSSGCIPSFPITGHPTKLCGYYKCFPVNGDTIQIGIMMFKNGVWIAGGELITTETVSNWISFNIPIYSNTGSYTNVDADSATITVAAFYNDTTCGNPYGPYGNSVLYVDNLSFDNLITSISEQTSKSNLFNLFPNPANNIVTLKIDYTKDIDPTLNIYNLMGFLVRSETLKQNQQQINVSDLSNGIYMIEIKSKELKENQKLIIQR